MLKHFTIIALDAVDNIHALANTQNTMLRLTSYRICQEQNEQNSVYGFILEGARKTARKQ